MGNALQAEYEDVLSRGELFRGAPSTVEIRQELLDAYLAACDWIPIYFLWRPNLRDEADNHLVELALAGGADAIVTYNRRDFVDAELSFPHLKVLSPSQFLKAGE